MNLEEKDGWRRRVESGEGFLEGAGEHLGSQGALWMEYSMAYLLDCKKTGAKHMACVRLSVCFHVTLSHDGA